MKPGLRKRDAPGEETEMEELIVKMEKINQRSELVSLRLLALLADITRVNSRSREWHKELSKYVCENKSL